VDNIGAPCHPKWDSCDDLGEPREAIRRAILTLIVLPDAEARWLRRRTGWLQPTIRRPATPGGAVRRFQPTAHDISAAEPVAPALAGLRRKAGDQGLRLVALGPGGRRPGGWRRGQ
jgi:hypothetical protein